MVSRLITQTCDPLHARQWFKLREPVNWAVTAVLFAVCFIVLRVLFDTVLPFGGLIAGFICVLGAYCLFFYVLDKRAIRIKCPHCGKYIETNTPWICGSKGCRNDNVDDFPFIYRCENATCGYYPKAYKCHHSDCQKLIFFTEDRQETGYARCANTPAPEKPKPAKDEHEIQVEKKVQDIHLKELNVKEGELDLRLKDIKENLEPPKQESVRDRLRRRVNSKTELEDEVLKMHAEIDADPKLDPVEREKRHKVIDDEARRMPF